MAQPFLHIDNDNAEDSSNKLNFMFMEFANQKLTTSLVT